MLADPQFDATLSFFKERGLIRPTMGVFVCEVLNLHLAVMDRSIDASTPYGVCDSFEQLKAHATWSAVVMDPLPRTFILTPIRKADQPPEGGWRWHKWGRYIGRQRPQSEYLYDEPEIDLVYVFEAIALDPRPRLAPRSMAGG